MSTLFITDLDGTLFGPDSRVSNESAEIITNLSNNGALITVATARTPATVEPLLHDTYTSIPAIVLTGASMWDRNTKRYINPQTLGCQTVHKLEDEFMSHGINPFIYTLTDDGYMNVYHSSHLTSEEAAFYSERKNLELKKFIFQDDRLRYNDTKGQNVILFLGIGPTSVIQTIAEKLKDNTSISISSYQDIFTPERSYIEIFRHGISKAAAVLKLKKMLGADRLIVYGDNINDLPMFSVADESVAVANALPEVRSAATRTIGPNTQPSVALDIAQIIFQQKYE